MEDGGKEGQHFLKGSGLDVLECQQDNRACALLVHVVSWDCGNMAIFEETAVFFGILVGEEVVEHGKGQRFAEAARARDEGYLAVLVDEFLDEHCFVYEVVAFP